MEMETTRRILSDMMEQLTSGSGRRVSVYKRGSPDRVERMLSAEVIISSDDASRFVEGLKELIRLTERYA